MGSELRHETRALSVQLAAATLPCPSLSRAPSPAISFFVGCALSLFLPRPPPPRSAAVSAAPRPAPVRLSSSCSKKLRPPRVRARWSLTSHTSCPRRRKRSHAFFPFARRRLDLCPPRGRKECVRRRQRARWIGPGIRGPLPSPPRPPFSPARGVPVHWVSRKYRPRAPSHSSGDRGGPRTQFRRGRSGTRSEGAPPSSAPLLSAIVP